MHCVCGGCVFYWTVYVHQCESVLIINGIEMQRSISPQHPVTWQPSKEGDHLIGRITLSKRSAMPREAGSLLGLKVSLSVPLYCCQLLYVTQLTHLCLHRPPNPAPRYVAHG